MDVLIETSIQTKAGRLQMALDHAKDPLLTRPQSQERRRIGATGEMHLPHPGRRPERTVMDLSLPACHATERGTRPRQRLETDQTRLRPAQTRIDRELTLIGTNIDDGREPIAPERDIMIERSGHTLSQSGPAGRTLQELGVFAQTWRHVAIPSREPPQRQIRRYRKWSVTSRAPIAPARAGCPRCRYRGYHRARHRAARPGLHRYAARPRRTDDRSGVRSAA